MPRKFALDANEKAYLLALQEVDPDSEQWVTHWASGFDLAKHGADPIGCTYEGSYSVMKRLIQRKLVDKEKGRTDHWTGVAINDKGALALEQNG